MSPDLDLDTPYPNDEEGTDEGELHWDIHPKVVLQLGESLISDDVQALLELIKNAYDADASYCVVTVDSKAVALGPDKSQFLGRITIEDNGFGMGRPEIESGWFTVSNSEKAQMKADKVLTPKKRAPLGDKGLGRLGVQKLGRFVTIETARVEETFGRRFSIDWDDFKTTAALSHIASRVKRIRHRTGTKISITQLGNPAIWEDQQTVLDLQRKLSQLLFPFASERPFQVYLTINGQDIDLAEISNKIRDTSNIQVEFSFDGAMLTIRSRYRIGAFRPNESEGDAIEDFKKYVEADQGASFFSFLTKQKQLASNLDYIGTDGWFVTATAVFGHVLSDDDNPGPFRGEIDSYHLRQGQAAGIFGQRHEYSDFIKSLSGVRVFRDGFGIRPYGFEGNDWLGLGHQQTSATSFYGLRPGNTIGYVLISAIANGQLEEVTAREGFKDTPYYRTFFRLMRQVIDDVQRTTSTLRRGYNEYRKTLFSPELNITRRSHVELIPQKMKETARAAESLFSSVRTIESKVAEASLRIEAGKAPIEELRAMDDHWIPPVVQDQVVAARQLYSEARQVIDLATDLIEQIKQQLTMTSSLATDAKFLQINYEALQEQLEELTELAALGLTVETTFHELLNITKDLVELTQSIEGFMDREKLKVPRVASYVQHVRAAISSLHKQISHVTPSLRYMREQRDTALLSKFVGDIMDNHADRLSRLGIRLSVTCLRDCQITINKGRLGQVLGNLVSNSEFWLQANAKPGDTSGAIHVCIDAPNVLFYDDGLGVDPVVENLIFDPFITTKLDRKGRGLGLFIVRQLLDHVDCRVSLLPDRNKHQRRFKFQVDLSGVVVRGPQSR